MIDAATRLSTTILPKRFERALVEFLTEEACRQ
jgi:hypothetical protein